MGKPVKIADLAKRIILLSGKKPDIDIKIKYTGLRPGEKLYEELMMQDENLEKTQNDKIFVGHFVDFDKNVLQNEVGGLYRSGQRQHADAGANAFRLGAEDHRACADLSSHGCGRTGR